MIAGPNVASDEESFFQTDKQMKEAAERKLKQVTFGREGDPIQLPSKVLDFKLVGEYVYTGESAHVARQVDKHVMRWIDNRLGPCAKCFGVILAL